MHFQEHVHAERESRVLDFLGGNVLDGRHDDEDAVGAPRTRFDDLIRLVHEILAQRRQRRCVARGGKMLRPALERRRIGEHR